MLVHGPCAVRTPKWPKSPFTLLDCATMYKDRWYKAANEARSMMARSAQSSLGPGSDLLYGVGMGMVGKPPTAFLCCPEPMKAANFSSHDRPLLAPQAIPAACAAGVLR